MRVVSLEPWLTDLAVYCKLDEELTGIDHESAAGVPSHPHAHCVTFPIGAHGTALPELGRFPVNIPALLKCRPEIILCGIDPALIADARRAAADTLGYTVEIFAAQPRVFKEVLESIVDFGKAVGRDQDAALLKGKIITQLKNLTDNFYERIRNKKVTFLAEVSPPRLAGGWIPDLLSEMSAHSQEQKIDARGRVTSWKEISEFRPDVIIVAPVGETQNSAAGRLKTLEAVPEWEGIPAVKRGEVIFCDGITHFYRPGPSLIDSIAILVSAVAGLDSGYVTPRDSFFRLRYIELHRQKFGTGAPGPNSPLETKITTPKK